MANSSEGIVCSSMSLHTETKRTYSLCIHITWRVPCLPKAMRGMLHTQRISASRSPLDYMLDSRMSGKRANVFVHKQKPDIIVAHRGTKGLADKWTDIAAVAGGRRNRANGSNMSKLRQIVHELHTPMPRLLQWAFPWWHTCTRFRQTDKR
jgi:hypothetical protein